MSLNKFFSLKGEYSLACNIITMSTNLYFSLQKKAVKLNYWNTVLQATKMWIFWLISRFLKRNFWDAYTFTRITKKDSLGILIYSLMRSITMSGKRCTLHFSLFHCLLFSLYMLLRENIWSPTFKHSLILLDLLYVKFSKIN